MERRSNITSPLVYVTTNRFARELKPI